ncbi:hypothetical protein [Asticcacaulis benevestitus]|uniref:hypothetical protein n=1 Tax=Asticcacaulis benevestitus TaxID=347481 RepID=UPI000ACE05C7|nr:hypothetical protein [Asticcacaulis benevestitus]
MISETYEIAPQAKIQVSTLSPKETTELKKVLAEPSVANTTSTSSGHFVSRIGKATRVLWEKPVNSVPRILNVLSFSAASQK